MHEQIRVFVNRKAVASSQEKARRFAQKTGSEVSELNGVPLNLENVDTVVVVGGDGSVRSVMQQILEKESPARLVVMPGGSQNGLHHALVDAGAMVTESEKGVAGTFLEFHPGSVNEVLFHHGAGWDEFMVKQGVAVEGLRNFFPRKLLGYLGGAWALVIANPARRDENEGFVFRMAVTAPYCGPVRLPMFTHLSLGGENIGMMTVSGQSPTEVKAKAGLLAIYLRLGIHPPLSVVSAEEKPLFTFKNGQVQEASINADGEVGAFPHNGIIYVRRMEKSVRVAALVD